MLASPYCPNVEERGVVNIPAGHPLYSFIGSKYQDVLEEYLGVTAVSARTTCTWHTSMQQEDISPTTAALIGDARTLLENARELMRVLDPDSDYYAAVSRAADDLEILISGPAPSQSGVASAMAVLTQAMAGIY